MSGSGAEEAGSLPVASKAVLSMEIEAPVVAAGNGGASEDWRKALGKVVPAVVVLRATSTRAFDTEFAGSSSATGFVVDRRRGILLTNRHVVGPGPVVGEAMFLNREEIPVFPLYRDPVHDFGFFRYDPGAVQFMEYEEIPLAPEAAAVGLDIRVVGNDSGEKVSILAGTLARLDRDAPRYRKDGYNDFNTFYIQAASGTKSGSSGSPVIDCQGRAVALNAGSKSGSSSAYFLPLERVVRALGFLQKAKDESPGGEWTACPRIPRGTLQMTFLHKGFDETRRLGLRRETEQMVRGFAPLSETGMLVVDSVVPQGSAHKQLEPGDVLVRMNGEVVTQFLAVETLLDDDVGKTVRVEVERGGTPVTVTLEVEDLHSITPSLFLEVSGGVLHSLSYQQARNFRFKCGRVYVAEAGYMLNQAGVPTNAIITKMAGKDISTLEDFISVLAPLPKGKRVPLEFLTYADRHRSKSVLVTIDRHEWYSPPLVYSRDDKTGFWHSRPAIKAVPGQESVGAVSCEGKRDSAAAVSSMVGVQFSQLDGTAAAAAAAAQEEHREQNGEVVGRNADETAQPNNGDLGTNELNRYKVENDVMEVDSVMPVDDDSPGDKGRQPGVRPVDDVVDEDGSQPAEETGRAVAASSSVAERAVDPALVMMEVHVPSSAKVDGLHCRHFVGTGVIVHHSEDLGLVVVDKNTVVIAISDVMLAFSAYPIEIPAEVVFLHPVHNFALVAYDPSALGEAGATAVKAAMLHPDPPLHRGDPVQLVVLNRSLQTLSRKSIVTNPAVALNLVAADCPRYRAMNMDVIEIDTDFGNLLSGVLTDELGRVRALWGSFSMEVKYGDSTEHRQFIRGIPVQTICDVVKRIVGGCPGGPRLLINRVSRSMPLIRILEGELYPTLLTKARSFGLSDEWVRSLVKKDPVRRQVLRVNCCSAGSKAHGILEQGDMLLTINGVPVTCFEDVEHACQEAEENVKDLGGDLKVKVFRHGKEMDLVVGTDVRDGFGTTRMVCWAGCNVQDPHPAVRALGFLPEEGHGVYVAKWCSGSPSHRYGLYALQWIVEVNGKPTPDLQAFVDVTQALEDSEFVRVKTVDLNGKPRVLTLKQDLHYWPTWELRFDPATATWCRRTIKSNTPVP